MKSGVVTALAVWVVACQPSVPSDCPEGGCEEPSNASCAMASPPNLLVNPGFECGDSVVGWYAQFGEVSVDSGFRTGARAARLTATNATAFVNLWHESDAVTAPVPGKTYCAYAWVRGSAQNAHITLRRVGSNVDENFSAPLSTSEWTRLPSETFGGLRVVSQDDTAIVFRVFMRNAKKDDFILVDDVAVWESTDGKCTSF